MLDLSMETSRRAMSRPPAPSDETFPAPSKPDPMPPDIHYVYIYEVFNTASFSIVLGSPMLLFFQHLNASATILAIAACLAPVLNILQIPAAQYVEKVGYRRFVVSGWTVRSIIVVGMMHVALLPRFRRSRHPHRPHAQPLLRLQHHAGHLRLRLSPLVHPHRARKPSRLNSLPRTNSPAQWLPSPASFSPARS